MVSTLPPLLLLLLLLLVADRQRQPHVLDFTPLIAVFYFLCHFVVDSWWIEYWRGCLGTRALCKIRWPGSAQISHGGPSVPTEWELRRLFCLFRCQGYKHTHTYTHAYIHTHTHTHKCFSEKHANVCHLFTSLTITKNMSSSPHCYLCFIRFDFVLFFVCFFPVEFSSCFAFIASVDLLETHTEAEPKCSSSFPQDQHPCVANPQSSGDLKCLNLPISLSLSLSRSLSLSFSLLLSLSFTLSQLWHCTVTSLRRCAHVFSTTCPHRDTKRSCFRKATGLLHPHQSQSDTGKSSLLCVVTEGL